MAGLWYRVGTVSVTNGSKKVTGFGTQWKSTVYKPDKGHAFYGPDGKAYEIDYVESDTVLYLVMVYAGATANTQLYAIDITRTSTIPAFSRELSAFTAYAQGQYDSWQQVLTGTGMVTLTAPDGQQIQVPALSAFQPTSASLKALQALTPVKDKIPVFNGPAGAELIALTSWARTLIDDTDASSARVTMGAAPSGYGIGEGPNNLANFTTEPRSKLGGIYRTVGAAATGNPDSSLGSGIVMPADGTPSIHLLHISASLTMYMGQKAGDNAPSWRKMYSSHNVVGPVSQSGGIPTGSIVERGSNANGEYVRFADGTQWCWGSLSITDTPINLPSGVIYQSGSTPLQTFPIAFSSVRLFHNVGYSSGGARPWSVPATTNSSSFSVILQSGLSMAAFNGTVFWHAIGRWY